MIVSDRGFSDPKSPDIGSSGYTLTPLTVTGRPLEGNLTGRASDVRVTDQAYRFVRNDEGRIVVAETVVSLAFAGKAIGFAVYTGKPGQYARKVEAEK